MADKDVQTGILLVIGATLFLLSGLGMLEFELLNSRMSMLVAFVLVALGVYLIAKK
ncbi:MAG: hypothetical protein AABW59_03105 [archaeon]